jgi:predicted amidohydrolase
MKERFTIAAVQPNSVWGEEEWRNVQTAVNAVEEAVGQGAELITFRVGQAPSGLHRGQRP